MCSYLMTPGLPSTVTPSHTTCIRNRTHRRPETVRLRERRTGNPPQEACNNVPSSVRPGCSFCQNMICSIHFATVNEFPIEPACDPNREAATGPCCPLAAFPWIASCVPQHLHPGCPERAHQGQHHTQQEQARQSRTFGDLHTIAGSKSAGIYESMTPERPNSSRNPQDNRDHPTPQVDQDPSF